MVSGKEFRINDYITLKLEDNATNIYVGEELLNQCKYILLHIPVEEIAGFDDIKSIDEASAKLNNTLEGEEPLTYDIPPETEFWAHCSNLQVWAENDYNTKLLHSNLAFPLLKKLATVDDPKAKRVFKEEIVKRFTSGYYPVVWYIWEQGYLELLNIEELKWLFGESSSFIHYFKGDEFWFKLGNKAFDRKDFKIAHFCYMKSVEMNPEYEPGWSLLGTTCTHLGKNYYQEGMKSYERALELKPNSPDNLIGLGYIYSKLKEYKRAKAFCLKAIEITPNRYILYNILGGIYYRRKRYKKAKEHYLKGVQLKPSFRVGWSVLSEIYHKERNYKMAIKCANKVLKIYPRDYIALYYKGRSLYKIGLYSLAIETYQKALDLDEKEKNSIKIEDFIIYGDLSKVYYKLKDHDKSFEMNKKALSLSPVIPKTKIPEKLSRKISKFYNK